ncbi:hypothetical protein F442_17158, partial [Phytophthora nicotianae P10297]
MVKLFCTITGVTRPFAVEIDANLSVDDLKKAIKKVVKPNGIRKVETNGLRLFLANSG